MADFFAEINKEIRNQKSTGAAVVQNFQKRKKEKLLEESAKQQILTQRLDNIMKIMSVAPETAIKAFNMDKELKDHFGGMDAKLLGSQGKTVLFDFAGDKWAKTTDKSGKVSLKPVLINKEARTKQERKEQQQQLEIMKKASSRATDRLLSIQRLKSGILEGNPINQMMSAIVSDYLSRIKNGGESDSVIAGLNMFHQKTSGLSESEQKEKMLKEIERIESESRSLIDNNKPLIQSMDKTFRAPLEEKFLKKKAPVSTQESPVSTQPAPTSNINEELSKQLSAPRHTEADHRRDQILREQMMGPAFMGAFEGDR